MVIEGLEDLKRELKFHPHQLHQSSATRKHEDLKRELKCKDIVIHFVLNMLYRGSQKRIEVNTPIIKRTRSARRNSREDLKKRIEARC